MLSSLRFVAVLIVPAAHAAYAADFSFDAMVAEARKDCEKAAPAYPAHDEVPPPAGHCDALRAYYGIGEPVDDAKARACAYASKDYAVLSMLYANGRGVPRDIAVARKAVCDERDAAPAEISGRLQHLARIEAGEEAAGGYDFCDDATSGLTTGWCSKIGTELEQQKRDRRLAAVVTSWTSAQQAALAGLRGQMEAFVKARDGEVDLSGTARASMLFAAEDEVRRQFFALLLCADAGRLSAVAPAQAKSVDDRLNATWKRLRAVKEGELGTVRQADILASQRAWLRYRDAWVAFGKQRYPGVSAATWVAALTDARQKQLTELAGEEP
jgi:uncharacterized protein YecT (DUF1311 family)